MDQGEISDLFFQNSLAGERRKNARTNRRRRRFSSYRRRTISIRRSHLRSSRRQ
jgi:hypothetical protein